jgi:uncharacterized membrane protein (DUF2068 family)
MDWSTLGCALRGHVTFRPDEEGPAAKLQAQTPQGESWRCLRCGEFIVGEPSASGPSTQAPVVLRGKALREAVILRLFAVERFLRAVIIFGVAYAAYRFRGSEQTLRAELDKLLPAAKPLADAIGVNLQSSLTVARIRHLLQTDQRTLTWVAIGLVVYGLIELIEAIGLWSLKRWGEYVAVVATSIFIPLEIYELTERITFLRLGAFLVNVTLLTYLLWSKHLFGIRGGLAAYRAEREEFSLIEIDAATAAID